MGRQRKFRLWAVRSSTSNLGSGRAALNRRARPFPESEARHDKRPFQLVGTPVASSSEAEERGDSS